MSRNIYFDICPTRRDPAGCARPRSARLPAIPAPATFTLAPGDIDQLRRGDAPPPLIQQATAQISQWLLADGLSDLIEALLNQGGEPLRLIFNVDVQLRADIVELPLELLTLPGPQYAARAGPNIDAIVHLLPKVSAAPRLFLSSSNWPLRVLVARSSPQDLDDVPSAALVFDAIRTVPNLAPDLVRVELLTRENLPERVGLPTRARSGRRSKTPE